MRNSRNTAQLYKMRIAELEKQLKVYQTQPVFQPPPVNLSKVTFNPPGLIDRVEEIMSIKKNNGNTK